MEKSAIQLAKEKCQNLLKFFTEKYDESFEAVKVKDSDTMLDYAELKEGAEISTSTSNGSVPAPDGDYTLSNGAEITVKDGKIDKITKQPDAPVEEADKPKEEDLAKKGETPQKEESVKNTDAPVEGSPEEEATETPADETSEDNSTQELVDRISTLEDAVKSILQVINEAPTKEDVQSFNAKIEALSKLPTQLSADTRVEVKDSEDDKIKRVASLFTKK